MKSVVMMCAAVAIAATLHASLDFADRDRERAERQAERAQAQADRAQDLYDDANDALDEHEYRRAADKFTQVARMRGEHADAATYWLAYAQSRMGLRSEALATILDLRKNYPKSRWAEDGKALEVEIRQAAGQTIEPERVGDEDLKLLALNGLMQSDPNRALPVVEAILKSNANSIKIKNKALFVIAQSGSPQAMTILTRTAREGSPELRSSAIKYLGISGGENARKALSEVYGSTNDTAVKKAILKSFMISGDRIRLVQIAKTEPNTDLRSDAVRQLGIVGARNELADLYNTETAIPIRKSIIQAMFLGGNSEKLGEIARTEKDHDLRVTAIRNLGLMGGTRSGELLTSIYDSNNDREIREAVIKALFIQANAHALVGLARKEKDPELKKEIISKLSIMGSKEAGDYLMEFLKE